MPSLSVSAHRGPGPTSGRTAAAAGLPVRYFPNVSYIYTTCPPRGASIGRCEAPRPNGIYRTWYQVCDRFAATSTLIVLPRSMPRIRSVVKPVPEPIGSIRTCMPPTASHTRSGTV